ncbi:Uncharacterized protein HZ326_4029 [Fusarium oxysporum f. sp. albedinis]|nr:Uncharacterized protein HZ326_4029 [Fusarium oxysporum f. sp. albedinis]
MMLRRVETPYKILKIGEGCDTAQYQWARHADSGLSCSVMQRQKIRAVLDVGHRNRKHPEIELTSGLNVIQRLTERPYGAHVGGGWGCSSINAWPQTSFTYHTQHSHWIRRSYT